MGQLTCGDQVKIFAHMSIRIWKSTELIRCVFDCLFFPPLSNCCWYVMQVFKRRKGEILVVKRKHGQRVVVERQHQAGFESLSCHVVWGKSHIFPSFFVSTPEGGNGDPQIRPREFLTSEQTLFINRFAECCRPLLPIVFLLSSSAECLQFCSRPTLSVAAEGGGGQTHPQISPQSLCN